MGLFQNEPLVRFIAPPTSLLRFYEAYVAGGVRFLPGLQRRLNAVGYFVSLNLGYVLGGGWPILGKWGRIWWLKGVIPVDWWEGGFKMFWASGRVRHSPAHSPARVEG